MHHQAGAAGPTEARDRGMPFGRLREHSARLESLALAGLAALIAAAAAIVALRAWRLNVGVPLGDGDAFLNLGWVQNIVETGWYLEAPRLGAPYGQQHHDFPQGADQLHMIALRVLALLTGDAPASINIFYLLTFPFAALTAYWAMRQMRIPGFVAMTGAVIFALLPYHFLRGTSHVFLAAYHTVPLSCYLIIATLEGRSLFGAAARLSSKRRRALGVAVPIVLALLVASGGAYYAVFTLVLLAPATLIGWLKTRSRGVFLSGSLLMVLIVAFLGMNSLPTFLYRLDHGANPDVPVRGEVETQAHALRPVALLLPGGGHRLEPLADLAERYHAFPTTGEHGESLGLVGAVGLLGLLVLAVGGVSGAFGRGRRWARQRGIAALTVIALMLAVTGGFSSLIALLVSPQIRAWARISIVIGFFAVLAVCLVLGLIWRWARRTRWRPLFAAGMVGLLILAVVDQTNDSFVPRYAAASQRFNEDRAFVAQLEAAMPGGAVYQLPHRPYPEAGPRADAADYDHLRPYLHSSTLRWSYGAMKGREAGWQLYAHGRPVPRALPLVAVAGFSAVWVDRSAYHDRAVLSQGSLRALLGPELLTSSDGRFAVYDMRPYVAALRADLGGERWAALELAVRSPVWPRWQGAVLRGVPHTDGRIDRDTAGRVSLTLVNDGPPGREVIVSFSVVEVDGNPMQALIRWPDGTIEAPTTSGATPAPVRRTLVLAAGQNIIEFSADRPVSRPAGAPDPQMRIIDLWAMDAALLELAESSARQFRLESPVADQSRHGGR